MVRAFLAFALVAVSGLALADGKFARETAEFPAGQKAIRQVIDVGGCKQIGEVTRLSLMKVGPVGRSNADLILQRVQVRFSDASVDTVLDGDSAFYYDFYRLKKPCVDEILVDGRSVQREFRLRAELE